MIEIPTFSNQIKNMPLQRTPPFPCRLSINSSVHSSVFLCTIIVILHLFNCLELFHCTGCERCSNVYNVYPSNNILHNQLVFCRLHASNRFRCSCPLGQLSQYEVDRVYYRNNEIHCVKRTTWTKQHSSCYVYPQH